MAGAENKVNIRIASDDFETMKNNQYSLCFAKKVGDTFNVVWQSTFKYLKNNSFLWVPTYQLFGTNKFENDVTVIVKTDQINIGLGEQSTLSENGSLGPASTGGPPTAITMNNNYAEPIHPGLNQLCTDIDGIQQTTPIYVAPKKAVKGHVELIPKEEVMVWFEQNIVTSTMFSDARSRSVNINMTDSNMQTREYSGGEWITPSATDLALATIPILQIIMYVTGALTAYDLVSKIASKLTGVYKDITVDVTTGESLKVSVSYSEKQGLTSPERRFLATLMTGNTNDTLVEFTLESLALLGLEFTHMEVDVF